MHKYIVGLGNPGEKYKNSKHNAGFMMVDELMKQIGGFQCRDEKKFYAQVCKKNDLTIIKPQTYMNESGKAIRALLDFYKEEIVDEDKQCRLIVVYDDLDIELGNYKIQRGKTPKVHNGVNSIVKYVGSEDFINVRIGVDNRKGLRNIGGADYVLSNFSEEEKIIVQEVFYQVCEEITGFLRSGN